MALDRHVADAIPTLLVVLSGIYLALVPLHLLVLEGPGAGRTALTALGLAAVFGLARLLLYRFDLPAGWGHRAGVLVAFVVLMDLLFHLQQTTSPRESTVIILVVLAAGMFLLDSGWFAVVAGAALAGWTAAAVPRLPDPDWIYFGLALGVSAILGATVLSVRRRSLVRLERLRVQERIRQIELESALDQTEGARQAGEEARQAMESAIVQVKESEERFRRLAEATFEGVVFFREGRILDANPRAAQLFRVSVAQMVGDPVLNLVAPDHRDEAESVLLGHGGRSGTTGGRALEVEGRRYDGTRFPSEISVVDSLFRGGTARVLVLRDVTNQKRAERMLRRALEEAEANSRAKSSFLANMSHELRTPLNSVIGFANILLKKQADQMPEREVDYIRRIQANGEHLLALIEDILDLSKIDAERMELVREPVDVPELFREVVRMLDLQSRKRGLEIDVEVPANLRPAVADPRRLRQVLVNLVGNAVKFTRDGGVTLRALADPDTGRPLRLEVEDTGIGIPESQLEEIFAPFHQVDGSQARSFGGTGLGLAISRSLCELMGFDLRASSRVGEGSVFAIHMEPLPAPEQDRVVPADGRGARS
ncbi:MAG: PAS domain S-box protein [Gemmatimonadales bacterium]|nr:MAG: PAS domain S-box protein [Gemmatimonadales bacterium]